MKSSTPSVEEVFSARNGQLADHYPISAKLVEAVTADLRLADPIADADAGWGGADLLLAATTTVLRTIAPDHDLARYWPTLGGRREPDADLVPAFADLSACYRTELTAECHRHETRRNDPHGIAMMWPALGRAAAGKPVALIELGGAAGLCLLPDRYRYRYGDTVISGTGAVELIVESRGATVEPAEPMDIARRIGLELEPIRHDDAAAIAWLRDCVLPDKTDELARVDAALAEPTLADIDWRAGDYFAQLPAALAEVPADELPIVYGAHTLCCADEPERMPRLLADAGRDLVWITKEAPKNALGLVSDAADEFDDDGKLGRVILTAATYRAGRLADIEVLAEVDPLGQWLDWNPRTVVPR